MRIAIDARKLRDYGIGTYIRNLVRNLARIDRTTDYVLIVQPSDIEIASELGDNFRTVPYAAGARRGSGRVLPWRSRSPRRAS